MKKAVLSNRIYLEASRELQEGIDAALTYSIPSFSDAEPPIVIRNMSIVRPGLLSIPIGRTDLIPADYEIKDKRVLAPAQFPKFKFSLRASQQEVQDQLNDNAIINASVSWGKAQPHYSKIRIPGGWTTMGDIQVGDKVLTPENKESLVTGKYLHKDKPIYRLTFIDGRTTDACENHLWSVYTRDGKSRKLLTTKDLYRENEYNKYKVPSVDPIDDTEVYHYIHPYLLGFLLGDGGLSRESVMFSTADLEIVDRVSTMLPDNHTIKHAGKYDYRISSKLGQPNLVLNELRRLGLMNKCSHEKFVPEEYKYDSITNKLELLAGLLDSDGSIELSGKIEFCSTSEQLMNDFSDLIRSLGGTIAVSSRVTNYTYKGEKKNGRVSYRGRPTRMPFYIKQKLFFVPRKKARVKPGKLDSSDRLGISSIEYIGNLDCSCISIDDPSHLYITDNYIVTHNTFSGLSIAGNLGQKTLVITHTVPLRNQWVKETEKVYGFTPGIIGSGKFDTSQPITISNIQSLAKVSTKIARMFGTVILDEMHHCSAPTFSNAIDTNFARYKIGLSGTIQRKDGKHVVFRDYFGNKIFQPPKENYIIPEVHIIKLPVKFLDGTMAPWAIRVNDLVANKDYVRMVAITAASYASKGHNVLVVADRVDFLKEIATLIGPSAVAITGQVKSEDRDALMLSVGQGTVKVLAGTQSIFSEGISHNPLSCLVLATPVNNEPLLEQLIGRIVREYPGKLTPIVVDLNLIGNTARNQANARLGHYIKQDYKIRSIDARFT